MTASFPHRISHRFPLPSTLLTGLLALSSPLSAACDENLPINTESGASSTMLFAVGTASYEWSDASRPELATTEPDDVRRLAVRAWYPAAASGAEHVPYFLNPLSAPLNATVAGFPEDAFSFDMPAALDAPLLRGARPFPVLVFSPGMSTPVELYGQLLAKLASHGFVIFAITHPYATGVVVFADGTMAVEPPDASATELRDDLIATWSLDQRFVRSQLEQITAPDSGDRFQGRLELDRVGVFGHSRGGAAAALSCRDDARFSACANLDGSISTPLETTAPPQPFLLLRSEIQEGTLESFFSRLPGVAYQVDVAGANHNDFSDLPQLVADLAVRGTVIDPAALLLGTLAPERSREITTAALDAFFAEQLHGRPTEFFSAPPFGEVTVQNRR